LLFGTLEHEKSNKEHNIEYSPSKEKLLALVCHFSGTDHNDDCPDDCRNKCQTTENESQPAIKVIHPEQKNQECNKQHGYTLDNVDKDIHNIRHYLYIITQPTLFYCGTNIIIRCKKAKNG
jgi:hypothetical protein